MELSNEIRMSIIISLEHRQYQGMYKKTTEHTLDFRECNNEDLIYYRDEWLVSEFDLNDIDDLQLISGWYDEDVFEYWAI